MTSDRDIQSKNEQETDAFAADLAWELKSGDIILLRGNLGSGKTTLARALIRSLCGQPNLEVPSPTFTLVQTYDTAQGPVWHFDLYRLKDPDEIYETGWEEALSDGILVVEWPERLGPLLPPRHLDITFSTVENDPSSRLIQVRKVGY